MPIQILEESLTVSRLNRNFKVKRAVHYLELTTDASQEKLDVQVYHAGALPHILACYDAYIKNAPAPIEFEVQGARLTFFAGNEFALLFLRKMDAISQDTYELARFCLHLDASTPHHSLRA